MAIISNEVPIPGAKYQLSLELWDMIKYASESGDDTLVTRIMNEHNPATLTHLKELHEQYRKVSPSLQDGTL
jgi:hypothetical protein